MADTTYRNDAARAEHLSLARATLFYLMAAALILSTILGLHNHPRGGPLVMWGAMALIMALNLSSLPPLLKRKRVNALMNDESTREHRRSAFVASFWATLAAAVALAIASPYLRIGASEAAQLIVTVALTVALVVFAALERRAIKGG
jgi:small-conductance mechanosensitive channel